MHVIQVLHCYAVFMHISALIPRKAKTSSQGQEVTIPSVLDVLRAAKPSALNRKRKVLSKKKVTPLERVKGFPGEQLVVSRGKLFCSACREELHVKSSTIKNHIRLTKHVDAKKKFSMKEAREKDITAIALKHKTVLITL